MKLYFGKDANAISPYTLYGKDKNGEHICMQYDENDYELITSKKDYAVLTSTHGSGASNFDPKYAEYRRTGADRDKSKEVVKWNNDSDNPFGLETKYDANVK